jgi:hypothetical protein
MDDDDGMFSIRRTILKWKIGRHARAYARAFPPIAEDSAMASVRALPLPPLLVTLMETGRWGHPGEDLMRERIPFIQDPMQFMTTHADMLFSSSPFTGLDRNEFDTFSEYRGSKIAERALPWLDVEKRLNIIVNREIGDDTCIALDYRTGLHAPRVVGCEHVAGKILYREISPSFESFVKLLEL